MNTLPWMLRTLGAAGVEVSADPADPTRLRFRPAVADLDRLRAHKVAILGLLREGYTPADDGAANILGERLGIGDDLGMPTYPGSAAWMIAIGESMNTGVA